MRNAPLLPNDRGSASDFLFFQMSHGHKPNTCV